MLLKKYDKKYEFCSFFDTENGSYFRTNVLKTNEDPFMASFPELIDVGIMGHCIHGMTGLCIKSGVQCYQNGLSIHKPNMTLENFKKIVDECKGKVFQFALGGRGDPDQHENFEEILKYSRENNIVPNFTSSGLGFNENIVKLCKKYCGAVAISDYGSEYTYRAIDMLLETGIKTNIHFVLGNNSIDRAIHKLKYNEFPDGISAVIFLLHKPVGLGEDSNVLKYDDKRVKEFFELVDNNNFNFKIGFDSCSVPAIINFTKNISDESFDTCEGARFSMYIDADMTALPCSFDQDKKWGYSLLEDTIHNAWNSEAFNNFRHSFMSSCSGCPNKSQCMGGCPIKKQIVLCNKEWI